MTELSVEQRLEQLETQMQKRIDRQNLIMQLLQQQAQIQRSILGLAVPNASENSAVFQVLSPLLAQYAQNYQQILDELPPDDIQGREYVRSLQDLLRY